MLYVSEIAVRQGKTRVSRERRCFAIISYKDLGGGKGHNITNSVQTGRLTNIRVSC